MLHHPNAITVHDLVFPCILLAMLGAAEWIEHSPLGRSLGVAARYDLRLLAAGSAVALLFGSALLWRRFRKSRTAVLEQRVAEGEPSRKRVTTIARGYIPQPCGLLSFFNVAVYFKGDECAQNARVLTQLLPYIRQPDREWVASLRGVFEEGAAFDEGVSWWFWTYRSVHSRLYWTVQAALRELKQEERVAQASRRE